MSNLVNVKQIVFTNVNQVELMDVDPINLDNIKDDEVVLKNLVTSISSGTEKANITGLRVGEGPVIFPRKSGYSNCAEVIKVGSKVSKVKVGDRVIPIWGFHASYLLTKEDKVVKVPDELNNNEAALCFIGTFPLAGIRKVKLEIGENCAVVGLGILGQLAISFAKAAGAYPVVGIDTNEERRKQALISGADYVFDPTDKDYIQNVLKVLPDGIITAIEVTGVGPAMNQTLRLMKKMGRIALVGCTRDSDFTVDYYSRVHTPGIEIYGAHTLARPEKESYPHHFTNEDDLKTIFGMIKGKRMDVKPLIKEVYSPKECKEVYSRLINDKNFPVLVQFDWSKLD